MHSKNGYSFFCFIAMLFFMALTGFLACDSSSSKSSSDSGGTSPVQQDRVTMTISRSDGGSVTQTSSGVKIDIPRGAVPETEMGGDGSLSFSIETIDETASDLPQGYNQDGPIRKFGPSGVIFSVPVKLSFPVAGGLEEGELVEVFIMDDLNSDPQSIGGEYDASRKIVTAFTDRFSYGFSARTRTAKEMALEQSAGCIVLNNNMGGQRIWKTVFIHEVLDLYPPFRPAMSAGRATGAPVAPPNTTGWNSSIQWILSRGLYRVCVEFEGPDQSNPSRNNVFLGSRILDQSIDIRKGWWSGLPSPDPCGRESSPGSLSISHLTPNSPDRCANRIVRPLPDASDPPPSPKPGTEWSRELFTGVWDATAECTWQDSWDGSQGSDQEEFSIRFTLINNNTLRLSDISDSSDFLDRTIISFTPSANQASFKLEWGNQSEGARSDGTFLSKNSMTIREDYWEVWMGSTYTETCWINLTRR